LPHFLAFAPCDAWHDPGLSSGVRTFRQALLVLLAVSTAFIAVGLTAPRDGPFSIAIRPVFWRVDPVAIAEERASALGVDIDVTFGRMHLHLGWSAVPLSGH
jgi:hypothetical protein